MNLEALRGYLLEEAIAFLVRGSGYDLLAALDDPDALVVRNNGLNVRGRGAEHQADVLGELRWTPAFSYPIRLFVEAKHRRKAVGLEEIREAVGILADLNTRYSPASRPNQSTRRYTYKYAFFSASGFAEAATGYALAHEISLVDLRAPGFSPLLSGVSIAARDILPALAELQPEGLHPVALVRSTFRGVVGRSLDPDGMPSRVSADMLWRNIDRVVRNGKDDMPEPFVWLVAATLALAYRLESEEPVLIGMPEAPFVLALRPASMEGFRRYALEHGDHNVLLRARVSDGRVEVTVVPWEDPAAYALTFGLPTAIEEYVLRGGTDVRERLQRLKRLAFSHITVGYQAGAREDRLVRLMYHSRELDGGGWT